MNIIEKLITFSFNTQNELKFLHLMTNSYEKHKAFGAKYDTLGDLFDKLLETALSKYPKLNEITVNNTIDNNVKLSSYITGKLEEISDFRKELTESDFQNQFDTIVEEFRHLAYLLTLK